MIRKIPLFYPQLICKRITQRFISHVKVGKVSSEYFWILSRSQQDSCVCRFSAECVPGYSARGRLGLICLLACSSSWRVERNDLTLSDNSSRHAPINNHHQGNTERKEHSRECFTSELNKDLNLLVKNLLQLRRVGVHVVVHLLSHLQENLLILKPPDRLLSAHIVWTSSLAIPFFSFGTEPYLSTNESEDRE